ncbi:hypothetical protein BsWGS_15060 [Bradybaena similaris]
MRTYIYHNLPRLAQLQALTRYTSCLTPTVLTRNRKTQYCLLEPVVAQRRLLFLSTAAANVSQDHIVRCPLPDLDIPTNVPFHQFIFDKCDAFKDNVAVEDFLTGKQYTYAQLKEKSIKVASGLHKLGYGKGDVLLLSSPNNVDVTVLMLACAANGMWFSSANPNFIARELAIQLNHSGAVVLVAASALTATAKEALTNTEFPNRVKDLFVFGEAPGFQPFQKLLDDDGSSFPDVEINPLEDVYLLPYSSGTTGLPKGVMLTHRNCLANCMQVITSIPVSPDDRCLGLLPLYHIFGMVVVQFSVLLGGARISYLPKFDPEIFLKCIQDRKITFAHLVPPLVVFLAKHPLVSNYDLTSLKQIVCGAAPLGIDISNEFLKRFSHGIKLNQGYGLTETGPVLNFDFTNTLGSVGPVVPNTEGKIVDVETKRTLGPEERGEYCVRGPQVMKGYFKNQKATDEMIEPDGWLHTGDIGYYNKDGICYIEERLKELIKYKGSQVAPAELEALLLGHPSIQDAAVIGVPDEAAGELPKAFIVKKPGSNVSEAEIIQFIEGRVTHTKRLRGGVQFIDEVPKNPSGKILRRVLRAKYL